MKKIYRLTTIFENGEEEVNGFFSTSEKAEKMLDFIKKQHMLGNKVFKTGIISTIETSDKIEKIKDGKNEWLIM